MKAISLLNPWAYLMAIQAKRFETRSWKTTHRGEIAIHSSARIRKPDAELCARYPFRRYIDDPSNLPTGSIIAVGELTEIITTTEWISRFCKHKPQGRDNDEYAFGNYAPNRFAWKFENVRQLKEPVKCKGSLSVWEVPVEIEAQVRQQLA